MTPRKPLAGRRIVVTRAREQSSAFAKLLRSQGARVLVCPAIRIVPPRRWQPLDRAVRNLGLYDWLIFTSVNGVDKFMERARKAGLRFPKDFPLGLQTCAIGPATAARMRREGLPVRKISKDYVAESVLDALKKMRGLRVLIPRAAAARDVLPDTLKRRGARVEVVEAYRTLPDRSAARALNAWLRKGAADCVTFTSSSTVTHFFSLLGPARCKSIVSDGRVRAASIGPVTTATLFRHRWKPSIVARKPTTGLLAQAICAFYRKEKP